MDHKLNAPWTRKHDLPEVPFIPSAPKISYPQSLQDLIAICKNREPNERIKAAGSHWALSDAAISDHIFVETHDPNNVYPSMGRTLYDVVPGCLTDQFIAKLASYSPKPFDQNPSNLSENDSDIYLVHIETGKRVYQLYSELDLGDDQVEGSLAHHIRKKYGNSSYLGPWAIPTMGGAGGQTVFGALTTGTHGGDFRIPPMADSVLAMHLVTDGGKHYWIEQGNKNSAFQLPRLTNDDKLIALYGKQEYGGKDNFEIIRDNDIFNSVLVSAGRFGIVYSVILKVVRQFSLHEERRITNLSTGQKNIWQDVKSQVSDLNSSLYSHRFLQIAISVTPHGDFKKNLCGITKRWKVPLAGPMAFPNGRLERRGEVIDLFDNHIKAPRFSKAGNSFPYSPDPENPDAAAPPSFLELACANSNFIEGAIEAVIKELEEFLDSKKVPIGGAIAAVAVIGGTSGLLLLTTALAAILAFLKKFFKKLRDYGEDKPRLGQVLNDLREHLLGSPGEFAPEERASGIFTWQMIAYRLFESQQGDLDFSAISYSVLERFNYFNRSCDVNVDSIEVFFDATDPMLIAFVDALLAFETRQEFKGKAFVGYISLRFTGETQALLGMEKYPVTCAVEVAGLKDAVGTVELIDYAIQLARHKNIGGILHWGQRNESVMEDIQYLFGDTLKSQIGDLRVWRKALSRLTDNGRLDGFSSDFTRRVGLEIVKPQVQYFRSNLQNIAQGQEVRIEWDCRNNPSFTEVQLEVFIPIFFGRRRRFRKATYTNLTLQDFIDFSTISRGQYRGRLTATIQLNGESRKTREYITFQVN